jgi:hypothetical protein
MGPSTRLADVATFTHIEHSCAGFGGVSASAACASVRISWDNSFYFLFLVVPFQTLMIKFLAFRYSIIEPSKKSPGYDEAVNKVEKFNGVVFDLNKEHKVSFHDRGVKHLLFVVKQFNKNVFALEFAREEFFTKPVEGENAIEEVQDTRTPFIFVIIDLKRQIFLIQEKSTVFQNVDISQNKLERFFDEQLEYIGLKILLKAITDKKDFWREVETLDSINDFKLVLNAPNLFEGRFKASDLVKEFHDDYNFTELQIRFKSALGKLRLYKENAQEFISLITSGGGKYLVHAVRNGKKIILDSTNFVVKKVYDKEDIKEISNETIESDLDELDKYND